MLERLTADATVNTTDSVSAAPSKSFFVDMLTRDISLSDAILDLLDNCTDGIQRALLARDQNIESPSYKSFHAHITVTEDHFVISDNCGGISVERARNIAFRMGRPSGVEFADEDLYTVGTYGIGMKRSLFKIGRVCRVVSQTSSEAFQVVIKPEWFTSDTWDLPFEELAMPGPLPTPGTHIEVTQLRRSVAEEFKGGFVDELRSEIARLYSLILARGFEVRVNDVPVVPRPLEMRIGDVSQLKAGTTVAPYVYEASIRDVEVSLVVGFYRPLPSAGELEQEAEGKRYKSETAGWTIICNDRVVLYCDKSITTGWGAANVPRFHPQFTAVAGVVFFRSKHAASLPLTTTKRGLDPSSQLYLEVRDKMIEGMKLFTDFTNRWKRDLEMSREILGSAEAFTPVEAIEAVRENVPAARWTRTAVSEGTARRFVPKLPAVPRQGPTNREISFRRPESQITKVAEYLEMPSDNRSAVGAECFDLVYRMSSE